MKRLIKTQFFGILAESHTKEISVNRLEEVFYEFTEFCIGTSNAVCDYALLARMITHTRTKLQTLHGNHLPPTEAGEKCSAFYCLGY